MKRKSTRKPKRSTRRRLQSTKALGQLAAGAAASAYSMYNRYGSSTSTVRPNSRRSTKANFRRGGSMTQSQTNQDYRSKSSSYGYKASTRKLTTKLLRQEIKYNTYSLRNYGAWNRGFGAVQIVSNQIGAANTRIDQPVHLWDLTAVPQGVNSTGLQYPATFHQLYFTNETPTGVHVWETKVGGGSPAIVTSFGTRNNTVDKAWGWYPTDNNLSLRASSTVSDLNRIAAPGAKSVLQKVNVKMILNGPQTKPTKWCIQLVQLKQNVTPGVAVTASNPNGTLLADAFWSAIAKPFGYSPLDNQMPRRLQQYIKVLKTWTVVMDTPESVEDHLRARMHHLNLNINLNRSCNYLWGTESDRITANTVDIPENGYINSGDNEYLCQVHPNARVWLMVRALCEFQGPSIGPTDQLFPSYDIIMNATHRIMD